MELARHYVPARCRERRQSSYGNVASLLAGATIYGVSLTVDPLTNSISGISAVTAHTF